MEGPDSREATARAVGRDLEVLGEAPRYYDWIVTQLQPWFGRTLLECGAGSGHVTRRLLALGEHRVIATDVMPSFVTELRSLCPPPRCHAFPLDLDDLQSQDLEQVLSHGPDTILMVNVLEHVLDDRGCIASLSHSLRQGGRLLLVVPAHRALYSRLDRLYGHHRRYERKDIAALALSAGLRVRAMWSMNMLGAVAWWALHRVLGRTSLSRSATRVFNAIVPAIATAERLIAPPFGQSLVAVLERP